eukprot:gnl/TRDRNA2_/TRDRNA2_33058_c0_seq1.p1 gnl/TRDRNA2_/TRDRNA2_33058_c0~~gnl/TRDRNA2_/TRDRNA2_33058_c0_seq1.p1  ORF type:complete len:337 (-),score=45.58 gnl/TRDRNA2_/TRDRNA2_33058_c0_seq1:273-1283(-)
MNSDRVAISKGKMPRKSSNSFASSYYSSCRLNQSPHVRSPRVQTVDEDSTAIVAANQPSDEILQLSSCGARSVCSTPCNTNAGDGTDALDAQQDMDPAVHIADKESAPTVELPGKSDGNAKIQTRRLAVCEIPSPIRNRAKGPQSCWATSAHSEGEKNDKAATPLEQMEGSKCLQGTGDMSATAAMDRLCVQSFLWCKGVPTPIKGTKLYTDHMRPVRPTGTSIEVKKSSFGTLGFFLACMEVEGLLSLQPGLTDPVVTKIHFDACRKYQRDLLPQPVEAFHCTNAISMPFQGYLGPQWVARENVFANPINPKWQQTADPNLLKQVVASVPGRVMK